MLAVLTGDIINSRKGEVASWINPLKNTLKKYGSEPLNWEIYRGDSFQLSLAPEKALLAALHIKSTVKQSKNHDVRVAIGLGTENFRSKKITEANGSAYVNSGECYDGMKKQTLAIRTNNKDFDQSLNTMLAISQHAINNWSPTVAEVIKTTLENPSKNQQEIATLLSKSQSSISEALKRGGLEEIMKMNEFYINNIPDL